MKVLRWPRPNPAEPLTSEEEAEIRAMDAVFDGGDPANDPPDWPVGLLIERRRLLATLAAERADRDRQFRDGRKS